MPGKSFQSKLKPFAEFIQQCRARHLSYPCIAQALLEQHNIKVAPSTIFSFVKVRSKGRKVFALPAVISASSFEDNKPAQEFFEKQTTPQKHERKRRYKLEL